MLSRLIEVGSDALKALWPLPTPVTLAPRPARMRER